MPSLPFLFCLIPPVFGNDQSRACLLKRWSCLSLPLLPSSFGSSEWDHADPSSLRQPGLLSLASHPSSAGLCPGPLPGCAWRAPAVQDASRISSEGSKSGNLSRISWCFRVSAYHHLCSKGSMLSSLSSLGGAILSLLFQPHPASFQMCLCIVKQLHVPVRKNCFMKREAPPVQ